MYDFPNDLIQIYWCSEEPETSRPSDAVHWTISSIAVIMPLNLQLFKGTSMTDMFYWTKELLARILDSCMSMTAKRRSENSCIYFQIIRLTSLTMKNSLTWRENSAQVSPWHSLRQFRQLAEIFRSLLTPSSRQQEFESLATTLG